MTLPTQCWFKHPEVKHWLIVGMNDSTVLGGVRATEGQGLKQPISSVLVLTVWMP
ncbi:hypothetical protein [Escherichia coli]|uniref:hypothetical protein n=1 Tax=Escherichia coli TaxID=562 RepID=UPI0024DF2ED2|nr:hypothetical protein [Escherichia coli]